jgi:hypothetical protein
LHDTVEGHVRHRPDLPHRNTSIADIPASTAN